MQAGHWQQTEELGESPRAEDSTIAFRADQGRWLSPRVEDRWVAVVVGADRPERCASSKRNVDDAAKRRRLSGRPSN